MAQKLYMDRYGNWVSLPDPRNYRVEIVKPRRRITGVNFPYPGETWQMLNAWRKRYGLQEVTADDTAEG